MQKDQKKVPQKKVPYAKPIPAQFQQVSTDKQQTLEPLIIPAPKSLWLLECLDFRHHLLYQHPMQNNLPH